MHFYRLMRQNTIVTPGESINNQVLINLINNKKVVSYLLMEMFEGIKKRRVIFTNHAAIFNINA